MGRTTYDDGWDDEDLESDLADEEGDDTIPCPRCGEEVYEDSPRCPACGTYLSSEDEDVRPPRKPLWIIVGTILVLYIIYRWTFG